MTARGISLGIVNHNGATYLSRTLAAVNRLGAAIDEVLLIDNASTDASIALARQSLPRVRVIELPRNGGPGAARNAALREARHDRLLLIDNDAQPLPGCVQTLNAALDAHPGAALAMPAILYEDDPRTVQYAGAAPHVLGTPALLHAEAPVAGLDGAVRAVGSAITCCILIDRARLGPPPWFDDRLFIYLEDHEFGLRTSLRGIDCLVAPAARCLHGAGTVGVSIRQTGTFTPTRVRYTMRNRWLILLKLYQKRSLVRLAPALATFELLQLIGAARKRWLRHWLWAAGSTARNLPGVLRDRRACRRLRRRADRDVLVAGPFPFNPAMHAGRAERAAQRALDAVVRWNWRLTGGRP